MWTGGVNVLISSGFTGAYEQLLPEFERTSGIKVTTRSGASQASISQAASRRRSSCFRYQPPSWLARKKLKVLND
jgi:ABC-type molybdate transport system substrate-binding protein